MHKLEKLSLPLATYVYNWFQLHYSQDCRSKPSGWLVFLALNYIDCKIVTAHLVLLPCMKLHFNRVAL